MPIMIRVDRDDNARVAPLENVTAESLKGSIVVNVAKEAVIMTDQLHPYQGVRGTVGAYRAVKHGDDTVRPPTENELQDEINRVGTTIRKLMDFGGK